MSTPEKKRIRGRLIFLSLLALGLLLAAVFADRLTPFDPNAQDMSASLQAPGGVHLRRGPIGSAGICFPEFWWDSGPVCWRR